MRAHRTVILTLMAAVAWPAATALAQVETADQLEYPPLREFEIPQPTRVELDNGLVVMVLEDHELPLVAATARVRTGSRWEPADKIGLAGIAGTVQRTGGTGSMTGDEIDDFLENRAASVETSIGVDSGSASLSCLVGDLPEVMRVFADVLRAPVFSQDKIDVAMAQAKSGVARQNDNPQGILFREFAEVVYGEESPYGRTATYATLAAITRDDLLAWHERFYHPNEVVLGLVGDFDTDEVLALVREVFGDWPRGPEAPPTGVDWREEPAPGVYYVEKEDMTQSNIAIGHLGVRRDVEDYYAIQVFNEVFSGSFASRLFSKVRTEKGLAYAVSGSVGAGWDHPGLFRMFMTTKTETTGAGIEALLAEVERLSTEPISDEEVERAKQSILNSFIFNSDSTSEILTQQLTYEYFGYPLDWLDRYAAGIRGVTVAEVRAASSSRLHPQEFAVFVVGPAEGRDRPLEEFGEVVAVDITIPQPPVDRVEATDESLAAGASALDEAVAAVGGAERLAAWSTTVQRGAITFTTPQGEMAASFAVTLGYPGSLRQELTLPFGTMTTILTPDAAYQTTPEGASELDGTEREETEDSFGRHLLVMLRRHLDGRLEAVAVGDGVVQVGDGGSPVVLSLDGDGAPASLAYQGSFAGTPGEIVQSFDDWREVDGLWLPHRITATIDGGPMYEMTVEETTLDAELAAGVFDDPR